MAEWTGLEPATPGVTGPNHTILESRLNISFASFVASKNTARGQFEDTKNHGEHHKTQIRQLAS